MVDWKKRLVYTFRELLCRIVEDCFIPGALSVRITFVRRYFLGIYVRFPTAFFCYAVGCYAVGSSSYVFLIYGASVVFL